MIMTLKAICGYDGNIYGNGGTVEFGLIFFRIGVGLDEEKQGSFSIRQL